MKRFKEKFFWNLYAFCYDTIAKLTPYQEMQNIILEQCKLSDDSTLLEAGCGSGNFLKLVLNQKKRPIITAIDASSVMMAYAQKKCKNYNYIVEGSYIKWEKTDLNLPLPYNDNTFDRIVCTNVLYTLKDPGITLMEFNRVLKPGGKIVLASPKPNFNTLSILYAHLKTLHCWKDYLKLLFILVPLTFVYLLNLFILRKNKTGYYKFFNFKELFALVSDAAFLNPAITTTYADQDWLVTATKK